jgi:protein associated with RNAse G/E
MRSDPKHVIVIKLNPQRVETWRYEGRILEKNDNSQLIEAYFNRPDFAFHDIHLKENDRFIERYFTDRWYNIFEIHDRDDDHVKGWYCNVTAPAEFNPGQIAYVDLALDLLAYPDGSFLVLDEDEFAALTLDHKTRQHAREAINDLVRLAKTGKLPGLMNKEEELT